MQYYINIWKSDAKLYTIEEKICSNFEEAISQYYENKGKSFVYMCTLSCVPDNLYCARLDIEDELKHRKKESQREAESDRDHEISMSAPDIYFDKEF